MTEQIQKNEWLPLNKTSLKQYMKQFPAVMYVKRNIVDGGKNRLKRMVNRRNVHIVESFPLFAPGSAGSYKDVASLTTQAANQIFPFINHLIEVIGKIQIKEIIQADSLCQDEASKKCAHDLKTAFNKYGSDKSTYHNYHFIYGSILKNTSSVTAILEIGLGTNNIDVVSNMGRQGKPGASLRGFRDVLPNASVYGADVDKRVLFEEERIKTFYVDQTDLKSFDVLSGNLKEKFDLIIDDGLHSPNANIATLAFAVRKLKQGGWFVIEDVTEAALPVWYAVAVLLAPEYRSQIVATSNTTFVFLVEKK